MKKLIVTLSVVLMSIAAQAQDNLIKGQLFDLSANNQPITFGNVTVKETKQSVSTDFRGNYFFENLTPGTYTLEFSFLGYTTYSKQITVVNNKTIKFDAFIKQSQGINFDDAMALTSSIN